MDKRIICVVIILHLDVIRAASVADSWILFAKALKDSWSNCPVELGLLQCLKQSTLEVFQKIIKSDVIPLTQYARLERYRHRRKISVDGDSTTNDVWKTTSLTAKSWSEYILKKMFKVFTTHRLQIDMNPTEARARHRNNMLPMAALGLTAFTVFTVPLGLQFILIICGKAILISKMALLVASINGSRGVKRSGAHYGLYRTHNHGHHYWNRGDISQSQPRSSDA